MSDEDRQIETISLSVQIDPTTATDYLEIRDTEYFHPSEDEPVEFYVPAADVVRELERVSPRRHRHPAKTQRPSRRSAAKAKSRKPKQPRMYKRFIKDDALVAEVIEGLTSKPPKYPNRWQAALALAPKAEGSDGPGADGSAPAKVFRLNRKIGQAYNLKTSQNNLKTSQNK